MHLGNALDAGGAGGGGASRRRSRRRDGGPNPDPMRLQHCTDTIVAPHISWYSEDSQIQMAEMAAAVIEFLTGPPTG